MSDKLAGGIKAGSTSVSLPVELRLAADSTEKTGAVYTDVTGSYWRQGGVRTSITMATLGSVNAAYSSGGFVEVDGTNQPGVYRFDVPDAAFANGADWVVVTVKVASCFVQSFMFQLETVGAAELSARIPAALTGDGNIKADTLRVSGTTQTARDLGASVLLSSGTGTGQILLSSGKVVVPDSQKVDVDTIKTNPVVNGGTITFPTTATLASTTNITAGTIATVTNLTNAPSSGDFTSTMKASLNAATPAVTVSDKTGFSLSSAGVQAIWDALTSALTTVGSIGKKLADWVIGPTQTGDSYARLGSPAGASISADIATKLATSGYTSPPSAATIATAVRDVDNQTPAANSLGEAINNSSGGSAPTASDVADAVCDELLAGHAISGSVGAALSAASASGDPWATLVPGAYDDGTAGAAIGRLNNTPADAPVIIIPDPAEDTSLCTVYVYTESVSNVKSAGIQIDFRLLADNIKSERVLELAPVSMTTDSDGFAQITLQRTDLLTPAGKKYVVTCAALGIVDEQIELTTDTFDLATLVS